MSTIPVGSDQVDRGEDRRTTETLRKWVRQAEHQGVKGLVSVVAQKGGSGNTTLSVAATHVPDRSLLRPGGSSSLSAQLHFPDEQRHQEPGKPGCFAEDAVEP